MKTITLKDLTAHRTSVTIATNYNNGLKRIEAVTTVEDAKLVTRIWVTKWNNIEDFEEEISIAYEATGLEEALDLYNKI